MTHPLSKYANLTLHLQEPIGTVALNPETGNYEQAETPRDVQCYVSKISVAPRTQELGGTDLQKILITGFFVNPKTKPAYYQEGIKMKATLKNLADKTEVKGEFYPEIDVATLKPAVRVMGNRLQGWFMTV